MIWKLCSGSCLYCSPTCAVRRDSLTNSFKTENRWGYNGITMHTAKTQYRKFETIIPRKGFARPQSQFPHSSVWAIYIYIPTIEPILVLENVWPIIGIYNSITDTRMWNLGQRPHNSISGNTKMGFSLQCRVKKLITHLFICSKWKECLHVWSWEAHITKDIITVMCFVRCKKLRILCSLWSLIYTLLIFHFFRPQLILLRCS